MKSDSGMEIDPFLYLNRQKVDSLFSIVNGSLENERKEQIQKSTKGFGRVLISLGNILAQLGLSNASAEASVEKSYQYTIEKISTLTHENKCRVLMEYFAKNNQISEIVNPLSSSDLNSSKYIILDTKFEIRDLLGKQLSKEEVQKMYDAYWDSWHYRDPEEYPTEKLFSASFTAILTDTKLVVPFVSAGLFRIQYFLSVLAFYNTENLYQFGGFKVFGRRQIFNDAIVIDPIAIWLSGTDD